MAIVMATVKRRGIFRQHEPYATRDLNWYMDWKVNGYVDYLDMIDPDRLYTLEYDTDVPTQEELLNGIDQHHVQTYNPRYRKDEKEEKEQDNNTDWFFNGEIVLQDEEEINPFAYAEEVFLEQERQDKEEWERYKQDLEVRHKKEAEERRIKHKEAKERRIKEAEEELKAKRRQEEKEARERRLEYKKAKEEKEKLRRQKENAEFELQQLRRADRDYVDRYFQEYGREGLSTLFQDSAYHIGRLNLQLDNSDVVIENDVELLMAYKYRQEYIKKLIQQERQKENPDG